MIQTNTNSKENMFDLPSDQDLQENNLAQNIENVDFNWIQGEVDQI